MREFYNDIKKYITPSNSTIMFITIVCCIIQKIIDSKSGNGLATEYGDLAWWKVFEDHQYYRLISYMFLHDGFSHIFNNLLVLAFVGSTLERIIGSFKYTVGYFGCGIVAGLTSAVYNRWMFNNSVSGSYGYVSSIGASGAVFGIVGMLLLIVLVTKGRVGDVSPRQLIMFIILSVYAGIAETRVDNIAHFGGLIFGIISAMILFDRRGGKNEG